MRAHDDPSSMDRRMDVAAVPLTLVYGATSRLALMGTFPYLDKRLKIGSTGAERKASGLGDIMTAARYQVYERNRKGETLRGALFAGLKWPTGKDDESDSSGLLPPPVQFGSGSYDPLAGTVWSWQKLSFQIDADFLYRRNTSAGGFKSGDMIQEDVSFQVRLWPKTLKTEGVPKYLYGVLEANSLYQYRNEAGGVKDGDSGGYQLFLAPGLQWVSKRTVLELAVQLPAIQNLNGSALKTDFNLLGGFRWWF